MRHVFVESNWVFACCAPRHLRNTAAESLLQQARHGALVLHLPAICLREGGDAIRKKCQPRIPDEMKSFVQAARDGGMLSAQEAEAFSKVRNLYDSTVSSELRALNTVLDGIQGSSGVDAFALSDDMLARAIRLRSEGPSGLKPFDEAILAAVLVRAQALRASGANDISFCTLDSDLQPWTKDGKTKPSLEALYAQAGLWVYGDFLLEWPERPLGWSAGSSFQPP